MIQTGIHSPMLIFKLTPLFLWALRIDAAFLVDDHDYEETISTRLTFADNGLNFPLLPFDDAAHMTSLGATTVAVLGRSSSGGDWALWSVDTTVVGDTAVQPLVLKGDAVTLKGSCIAPGAEIDSIFILSEEGVFSVACEDGTCAASLVAAASEDLEELTTCASSHFSDGSAAVAAATPTGLFMASIAKGRGFSKSTLHYVTAHAEGAPPAGEPVLAVALAAGWSNSGSSGLAVACSTKDHVHYAVGNDATSADGAFLASLTLLNVLHFFPDDGTDDVDIIVNSLI